jgi:hypothetical protein
MVELGRARCKGLWAVVVAVVVSLCAFPLLALGEDVALEPSASGAAQVVHFSGADFAFPEMWRGKVEPRVSERIGSREEIHLDGATLLGWDPEEADFLDQWRDNWRPMDYEDVFNETLPDGTVLIFGRANDTARSVEIKDPEGREGCLWTYSNAYLAVPFNLSETERRDAIAAYHKLQAETAGLPESASNDDRAFAFLRECAKRLTITLPPTEGPEDRVRQMHRLYNPYSGEHFYTASTYERDSLTAAGWSYEGVGWTAPAWGDEVHRLYNPYSGDHHYTTSREERDALTGAGWKYEGIGWRSGGDVPVMRQYNPYASTATHNYTTSKEERAALVSAGWRDEGVGWYGV